VREEDRLRADAPLAAKPGAARPGGLTYKDAGVNIDGAEEALARVKTAIRASFTPGVLGDVGLFGGLFDLERAGGGQGILVASADGVGTKLEVAKRAGIYHTVGRDLVQHCIDDILVQGARPLFFMDYVAAGVLEPGVISEVVRGCAEACSDNGLALLGGETAEMPGMYAPGDFDLAGFIVGVVEPDHLLDGSRVRPGQVLLGLRSAGLHTNGYSLARKVLFELAGLGLGDRPDELGGATVAEALLAEHRSYESQLRGLIDTDRVAALAHITGGGLRDNLPRILGDCDAVIDRDAWEVPGLFRLLIEAGGIELEEAHRAFNMGIGMVILAEPDQEQAIREHLAENGTGARWGPRTLGLRASWRLPLDPGGPARQSVWPASRPICLQPATPAPRGTSLSSC
jgi:phosphoribosylformylglycinamidine cyclo-ligase